MVVPGELDRAERKDLSARCSDLEHLLEGDPRYPVGGRNHAGISGEHSRDVRVDLAELGSEGSGECHCCGIGASAAKGGHVPCARDSLEAGHDRDDALSQRLTKTIALHLEDPCLGVRGIGDDACLAARERGGWHTELRKCHAQQ